MKIKYVTLVVLLAFVLATICCSAAPGRYEEIPRADIAIGGITIGATENYVKSIYGEPNDISFQKSGYMGYRTKTYRYGNSFFIMFWQGNTGGTTWIVADVKSTGNNGLKTPGGFAVGMKLSDVYNRYGPGRTSDNSLFYTSNWWLNIMFKSDKNGKITEIHIYSTP